jgi:hypothetical protein
LAVGINPIEWFLLTLVRFGMNEKPIIEWLLEGDVSIQYQVYRDLRKRNKNGTWNMQAAHPGKLHFVLEEAGAASRWNTLRALRVLKHFKLENYSQ